MLRKLRSVISEIVVASATTRRLGSDPSAIWLFPHKYHVRLTGAPAAVLTRGTMQRLFSQAPIGCRPTTTTCNRADGSRL